MATNNQIATGEVAKRWLGGILSREKVAEDARSSQIRGREVSEENRRRQANVSLEPGSRPRFETIGLKHMAKTPEIVAAVSVVRIDNRYRYVCSICGYASRFRGKTERTALSAGVSHVVSHSEMMALYLARKGVLEKFGVFAPFPPEKGPARGVPGG
jgi:hypothetical protein